MLLLTKKMKIILRLYTFIDATNLAVGTFYKIV